MAFFLLVPFASEAQMVIRIIGLPAHTSSSEFYLAGTFNNWNPRDSAYRFVKAGNSYKVSIPFQSETFRFKVTQGSWEHCEATSSGARLPDRVAAYVQDTTLDILVSGWEQPPVSTALSTVTVLTDSFFIPQLNTYRRVTVCLPRAYHHEPTQRYPVLYMHDGQNVFDQLRSFSGEWGVDETLSEREKHGDNGCIVVAIDNGGAERINEYSPFVNATYGGGRGHLYVNFLVLTLKPFIDSVYRTLPQKKSTAIAGSSMGGLISLYAAIRYPEVYGWAGVFSPSLWFSDSVYTYTEAHAARAATQFYLLAGSSESRTMEADVARMAELLRSKGCRVKQVIEKDGEHAEWFWRREFGTFYDWLFER